MIWVLRRFAMGTPLPAERWQALTLFVELNLLSACFAASGGSSSPFTMLYLAPVMVGAMTLSRWPALGIGAAACGAYGSLFVVAPADLHHHDHQAMQLHLAGMYAAFVLTSMALVWGFQRLRDGEQQVREAMEHAEREQARSLRLAGLATLAAGASHELASPLSTILLVSRELQRKLPEQQADLELIAAEVMRCQGVLEQLSVDVGVGPGELGEPVEVRSWLRSAVPDVEQDVEMGVLELPIGLMGQVVRQLVANARGAPVRLTGRFQGAHFRLEVIDQGPGMSEETLEHALEPFFTTNAETGGRGLGLYFCAAVVEQLGGTLTLESALGQGTTVRLCLPVTPEEDEDSSAHGTLSAGG